MANKVEIELLALTKKATKDIKSFSDQSSAALKAMGAVAVGALGVFASKKLLSGISDVTKAAAIQEQAVQDLNSALFLAGDFTQEASSSMQAWASSLQSTTRIGDETTLQMLALAKSFGVSNDGAKDLVAAAVDLSQVTGMSLEGAVRNLGKTYGGLTGELGEVVPALKNLTKEQLMNGEAVGFITDRFGGAAEAATNTYGGAIDQLSNAFGDLQEELGEVITANPAFIKAIKGMKTIIEDLGKFVVENQEGMKELVAGGLKELIRYSPLVVRSLTWVGEMVLSLAEGANMASKVFAGWLLEALKMSDDLSESIKLMLSPMNSMILAANQIKKADLNLEIRGLQDSIRDMREEMHDGIVPKARMKELIDGIEEAQTKIREIGGEVKLLGDVDKEIKKEIQRGGEQAGQTLAKAVVTAIDNEERIKNMRVLLSDGSSRLIKGLENVSTELDENSTAVSQLKDSIPQPGDANFMGPVMPEKETSGKANSASFGDLDIGAGALKPIGKAVGTAVASNLAGGFAGGQKAASGALTAVADLIAPGVGGFIGPVLDKLATSSKEEARAMAEQFAQGIVAGIDALVENIPIFIEALAENSGEIITALVAASPRIAIALAEAMPMVAEALVMELINGFNYQLETLGPRFSEFGTKFAASFNEGWTAVVDSVTNIPNMIGEELPKAAQAFKDGLVGEITDIGEDLKVVVVDSFVDAGKTFIDTIVGLGQQVIDAITPNALEGSASDKGYIPFSNKPTATNPLGFATGGFVKGSGLADSVPAMLAPGELVVDRTTGPKLMNFLDNQDSSMEMMARLFDLLSQPMQVETDINIGPDNLGKVLLRLNRAGKRLA